MELRLLRAFVAVADASSFTDAAAGLSITQPALTKQVQALESSVGTPLFRRGRHGAELTPAGLALLAEARTLVDLADRLAERARRLARGEEGSLTVGFGLSSITVAPRAVAALRRRVPGVDVRLEDMASSAQVSAVRDGILDVAFARLPVPPDLRSVPVLADRLAVAFPLTWPTPPNEGAALALWFGDKALIRLRSGRGPGLAAHVARFLADGAVRPASVQEADDLQTVLALVAAGAGAAVVPESALHIAPARVGVISVPGESAAWTVGAVWRSDNASPIVRTFLEELARLRAPIAPGPADPA
jgi:DNA-binding transcriptional LysR family regulator